MNIVIASGKGGTGKTTVAINLAYAISKFEQRSVRLLDCDVEAPNDNLFLDAQFTHSQVVTVVRPAWEQDACVLCGKCSSVCQYNAIAQVKEQILIFDELCHSCGACCSICPSTALKESLVPIGQIDLAPDRTPFSYGQGLLKIGQALAPKVIQALKGEMLRDGINIVDASPGTTCPVVKSMEGMDCCLLVTESTPFGLHDLQLAASLAEKLKLPTGIIINRSYGRDEIIENFARQSNIPIVAKIPFSRQYAQSYSRGEILLDHYPELIPIFRMIYQSVLSLKAIPCCSYDHVEIRQAQTGTSSSPTSAGSRQSVKEIVVISGKGGTGKTTITSALCELMEHKIVADTDVDASNLHLLLHPVTFDAGNFIGGKRYQITADRCSGCGECQQLCRFEAVECDEGAHYRIVADKCEGCGLCALRCRSSAISSYEAICGQWYLSHLDSGELSHARLGIGEENSGKLVSLVRQHARALVKSASDQTLLSDGPPGTGCPVISAITGVDLAIIVTEPTLSGVHDMKRALELAKYFRVQTVIVVNKCDLNEELTHQISEIAKEFNSKIIGNIPFDRSVHDSLVEGKTIISYGHGAAYEAILDFWTKLKEELK